MNRFGAAALRLLRPGGGWALFWVLAGGAALFCVFVAFPGAPPALACAAYLLSAYGLAVLACWAPGGVRRAKALVCRHRLASRYLADLPFRVRVSLYVSLALNLLYAGSNLWAGLAYSSSWSGAIAVYYSFLSVARFTLLRTVRGGCASPCVEWRQYRFCGGFLLVMELPLAAIAFLMVYEGQGYRYPGTLIYAAAAYAFYSLCAAVVSLCRCRGLRSPVLAAAQALNLAVALAAMLALETAMFAAFGSGEGFERGMTAATGAGVCLAILSMALFMLARARRALHGSARKSAV